MHITLAPGLEEGANNTLGAGFKHVASVLRDIEKKVADFQRAQVGVLECVCVCGGVRFCMCCGGI